VRVRPSPGGAAAEVSEVPIPPTGWPAWYVAIVLAYAVFLAAIAVYDARWQRIPNRAVYPAVAAGFLLAFFQPTGPWWSFMLAGLFGGSLLLGISIVSRGGLGLGDAKLAVLIGLMSGWPSIIAALFLAFAGGAVVGGALLVSGRIGRRDPLPFGPALAVGALAAVFDVEAPAQVGDGRPGAALPHLA
jgi:prepilin signal peptidase PulO-like enzyme (type II secretory pathway)